MEEYSYNHRQISKLGTSREETLAFLSFIILSLARSFHWLNQNRLSRKRPHMIQTACFLTSYSMKTEKAMAPHSSTLAWKISWTEEPGGLQSMGLLRVGHHWVTSLPLFTFMHWRRKWQYSCLENPRGRGGWWADVHGVEQSQTRLKRLSSSSMEKGQEG